MRRRSSIRFVDAYGDTSKHLLPCLSLVLGLAASSTPAWPQPEQPVTAAELVGAVRKIAATSDRVIRRDGRQIENRYKTEWTIHFVSEETIRPTFVATSYSPKGTHKTPPEAGNLVTLGRPRETATRGGGHRVWIFDAGVLTFLRTYEGGAMKGSFAVTRSGTGFKCTASVSWPKETGVATIVLRSFVDNAKVEILSSRQSASSCTISKP